MRGRDQIPADATLAGGADWVIRLQAPQAGESDWIAFEAWLGATAGGRAAFDEAMSLWLLAGACPDDRGARTSPAPPTSARLRAHRSPIPAALGLSSAAAGLAIAATVLVMIHAPVRHSQPRPAAPTEAVYATARGERRTVGLADGTQVDLSGASRVVASLQPGARQVTLTDGEAAFNVAHDPRRPFTVSVGDRQVRDLGTQFDIRRAGPMIEVTVRRGMVEVTANGGTQARAISLSAGRRLRHQEGTTSSTVQIVSADETFAWMRGRLIYRDQTLREVVDDLNRYFPHAVRLDDERTGDLRFSGVLAVDEETATMRRLTGLLPISATRINGATVLKAREDAR
jgi:transmembrane sensor